MKNLFLFAMLSFFVFFSCSEDEDNEPKNTILENQVIYENMKADLDDGALYYYPGYSDGEGENVDIYLFSHEMTVDLDGDYEGSGAVLYFEMYSTSSDLEEGVYYYDDDYSELPFTFTDGEICFSKGNLDIYNEIVSGEVSVEVSSEKYTITFDCVDEDRNVFKGHYKGELDNNIVL